MASPPGSSPLAALIARARSMLRGLLRRERIEEEMREEFRVHIEMRAEHLVRQGLAPSEARRRAHLEFGHVETHRERARAARGLRVFDQLRFSWLDVKLGLRMLVKHPGLTVVAVVALAVGIPVGMAPTHLASALEAPLPEDPDNRVRSLRYWDPATRSLARPGVEELELWAEALTSFSAVGASRMSSYNVASEDGRAAPVAGAQVTASTFRILARPPLLGRTLDARDEAPGAPRVVVLGHDLWRARFGSDPDVVGSTVRVGAVPHTVVGVMPEGFLFPVRQQVWLPLPRGGQDDAGPAGGLTVYGRLADGVSDDVARAELGALGLPPGREPSGEGTRLQAEVVPFALSFVGLPQGGLDGEPGFLFFQAAALVLLVVACGNVAMLVFARTATRFRELAVRTALGASRVRVVSQMFAETLVLAVLAAGAGLFAVDRLLAHVDLAALAGEAALPYWLSLGVTGEAVVRALLLAALSATVAGVVPALWVTGGRIQRSIRSAEVGRSGIRFGGVTGALIVADVALAVAVAGFALALGDRMADVRASEELAGIPAEEYLAVEVRLPGNALGTADGRDGRRFQERLAATQRTLVERLQAEPGVRSVAVADALPRMDHRSRPVEVEGVEGPDGPHTRWMRAARVDVDFFRALERPVLAGRGFDRADLESRAPPVLVNTVFVERVLGDGEALGRRVRFVSSGGGPPGPWHEIVGVVGHLGVNMVNPAGGGALYVPAAPGQIHPLQLGIHASGPPLELAARVRELVGEVDPTAVPGPPRLLSEVRQGDWYLSVGVAGGLALLVGILVVLVTSGIYALVSFSVSERTREIGIRTALGAPRASLLGTILRRTLAQVGVGALLGMPLAARVLYELREEVGRGSEPLVAVVAAMGLATVLVAAVVLCSCVVPARRVLAVEASEALRADG